MLDFLKQEDTGFEWNRLGEVSEGRQNLGEEMPVWIYRLMQYTIKDALTEKFGKETMIEIFRMAGYKAGMEFAKNMLDLSLSRGEFFAHLQETLENSKVGVMRIEKFDEQTGKAVLTISEDLDCSGLPVTGETVCNYDEGFLRGILEAYTKKTYDVVEVDCWATGSRVCRFHGDVK